MIRIALLAAALTFAFFAIAGAHGAVKPGDPGGGSTLPACTSAYWGMTINLFGYRWYCAWGANRWVIV